jgi:hypothetical protein
MCQVYTNVNEGKKIIKDIEYICGNDDIIKENIFFWKIEKDGEFDCYMIQNRTKDFYGVSDAIKIYKVNDIWYRDTVQCLRNITEDKHARIYLKSKTIYTAVYRI